MSEIVKFAKAELRAAGLFDTDADYGGEIAPCVVAMMETFTAYGHSGGSAAQTIELFNRLVQRKPLTPLTGDDSEWDDRVEFGDPNIMWQNNRWSEVFADKDGNAWIIKNKQRVPITFPYTVE